MLLKFKFKFILIHWHLFFNNNWFFFFLVCVFVKLDHRITESQNGLGWKGPQWSLSFNPPAMCRVANHQTRLPRATSSQALNGSRDGASTTSLGNLFQCVTTLCVKNFLPISNLNLPCLSLKPFPLVLSLFTHVNSRTPSSSEFSSWYLEDVCLEILWGTRKFLTEA